MKNLLKPFALFLTMLFVGVLSFNESSATEDEGVKGCRYSTNESDYCKWGPANIYNCVNNDDGTNCYITVEEEID